MSSEDTTSNPTPSPLEQAPEEEEDGELFRREVLEEQGNKLIGDVILLWSPRLKTLVIFYSLFAFAGALLLIFGSYQRKERVPGILVPSEGVTAVAAETEGRITELLVKEGDEVQKGQALIGISRESFLISKEGKSSLQLDELKKDQERRETQLAQLAQKQSSDRQELEAKIESLRQNRNQSQSIIQLKSKQSREAQKSYEAAERLFKQKIIARSEFEQQLANYSNIKQSLAEEETRLAATRTHLREVRLQRDELSQEYLTRSAEIQTQISELKQRSAESESQKQLIIQAPTAGLVSGLRASVGQNVVSGLVLMKLVPKDLKLEAHLFVSTRAAPFVKVGQEVWLQFEALSPTKYGVFPGRVMSISQASLNPTEITEFKFDSPRYLTRVELQPEWREAYQAELNFKADLLMEADILMGRQSLIEWILEPLRRARGAHGLEKP